MKTNKPCTPNQISFIQGMVFEWVDERRSVSLQIKINAIKEANPTLIIGSRFHEYPVVVRQACYEIGCENISKFIKRTINNLSDLTFVEASQVIKSFKADRYHQILGFRYRKGRDAQALVINFDNLTKTTTEEEQK